MKHIIHILLHFLIFSSLCGQDPDDMTDFEYKIIGSVKSITEKSYILDENGKIVESGWDVSWENDSRMYFDIDGRIIKVEELDPEGSITETDIYEYRDSLLIHKKINGQHTIYFYTPSGMLSEVFINVSNPVKDKSGYMKPATSNYISRLRYEYTPDALISAITEKGMDTDMDSRMIYQYRNRSNEIWEITFAYDDIVETHSYDYTDGQITEIKKSDSEDGLFEQYEYIYKDDKIVQETWKLFEDHRFDGQVVYKFDNYNLIEVEESDGKGIIEHTTTYTYEYDGRGNWTKQFFTAKGEDYMVVREIKYY